MDGPSQIWAMACAVYAGRVQTAVGVFFWPDLDLDFWSTFLAFLTTVKLPFKNAQPRFPKDINRAWAVSKLLLIVDPFTNPI